ncbi:MAG: hypothetical protein SFY69_06335 [Planctomycetota bacterium]|nr:hypothetical protein [Planctomycetota bacterium]
MNTRSAAILMLCVPLAAPASAGLLYNEFLQGDLSNNRFEPTAFTLTPGSNELFGVISGDNPDGSFDRDYFSFTVPAGFQLSSITLTGWASDDFAAFGGIQPGPVFPNDPETVQPDDLLGWMLFGPQDLNVDLLPIMGSNGMGFTPPLPAGTYSFWVQQIGPYTEYGWDVVVDVPSPGASALLLATGLAVARRRRS